MVFQQVCKYLGAAYDDAIAIPGLNGSKTGIVFTAIEAEDETLRFAVLAGYDVRSDSAALRRILDLKPMRRTSTMRREFSAMTISLPPGHHQLRGKLAALGFNIAA